MSDSAHRPGIFDAPARPSDRSSETRPNPLLSQVLMEGNKALPQLLSPTARLMEIAEKNPQSGEACFNFASFKTPLDDDAAKKGRAAGDLLITRAIDGSSNPPETSKTVELASVKSPENTQLPPWHPQRVYAAA